MGKKFKEKVAKELKKDPNALTRKLNFLFSLSMGDFVSFVDMVNSIASDGGVFVTENELILSIRSKIERRVSDFRILNPQEADKHLKNKEIQLEKIDTTVSYTG